MEGKIIKLNRNIFTVLLNDGTRLECLTRGRLRNENINPVVGDNVVINLADKMIEKVLQRKNELIRPLVSNIDKLIIVESTQIPRFSTYMIDKLLVLANKNKIEPIICITKLDKLSFREKIIIFKDIRYYKKIGIKVYKNTEIDKIKKEIKNNVVALTGQTGAGKSTLLNKIDKNLHLNTDDISVALGRGKHTTRIVELFELSDGLIADTPGFSSLDLTGLTANDLKDGFIEFGNNCKYKSCMHVREDGCNVIKRVKDKRISEFRYKNYLKLLEELKDVKK